MATCTLSADARPASLEITPNFPPVTRRAFAGMAAIGAVAAAAPAIAAPSWSAVDWLRRWHDLGCGARLDSHGNMQLTPRRGAGAAAIPLFAELSSVDRLAELQSVLLRLDTGCAAARQVERLEQIDREFVSDADDRAGHGAWQARWSRAYKDLERIPANSGRGLAAKLRQGIAGNGSDNGDRIIEAALGQLERWR